MNTEKTEWMKREIALDNLERSRREKIDAISARQQKVNELEFQIRNLSAELRGIDATIERIERQKVK